MYVSGALVPADSVGVVAFAQRTIAGREGSPWPTTVAYTCPVARIFSRW